jgi:hypothetical protein
MYDNVGGGGGDNSNSDKTATKPDAKTTMKTTPTPAPMPDGCLLAPALLCPGMQLVHARHRVDARKPDLRAMPCQRPWYRSFYPPLSALR